MVFGPNPVDLCVWRDDDSDSESAQDLSISGHCAHLWKLGMMTQEATLKGTADSKLRRLLARNKSSRGPDVSAGGLGSVLRADGEEKCAKVAQSSCRARHLREWRHSEIPGAELPGVTVKFRGHSQ